MHGTGKLLFTLATTAALALGSAGCVKQMILDGQIESTREGATAIDTLSDYEVASAIAFSGLGQFEGMRYLAPQNEDALFLLVKNWSGVTYGFIEDELEQAEDVEGLDSDLYKYQQARAKAGYERAIHYGLELIERKSAGFAGAKKNDDTMKAWLASFNDAEHDAPNLFWTAYAWMSRTNVAKEDPAVVADLFIGVAMMERAVALDEKYMYGSGHVALGAYNAASALSDLDASQRHFERALQINGGKHLLTKLNYAAKYYCMKGDRQSYERLLNEVLSAGDVLPEQRLQNTIAKRRAKRYLGKERLKACGF
jgi:tetratricopeptide (TPR) repeat protein